MSDDLKEGVWGKAYWNGELVDKISMSDFPVRCSHALSFRIADLLEHLNQKWPGAYVCVEDVRFVRESEPHPHAPRRAAGAGSGAAGV